MVWLSDINIKILVLQVLQIQNDWNSLWTCVLSMLQGWTITKVIVSVDNFTYANDCDVYRWQVLVLSTALKAKTPKNEHIFDKLCTF